MRLRNKFPLFVLVVIPILLFIYLFLSTNLYPIPYPVPNIYFHVLTAQKDITNFKSLMGTDLSYKNIYGVDVSPAVANDIFNASLVVYYPYHLIDTESVRMYVKCKIPTLSVPPGPPLHTSCPFSNIISATVSHEFGVPLLSAASLTICLLYGFYPLKYHGDDYFKKRGFVAGINGYRLVKKVLYFEIPLFVFLSVILYTVSFFTPNQRSGLAFWFVCYTSQTALEYSVTAGVLWIFCQTIRKEFRYYLAKAYVKSIPDNNDDTEKISWLSMALKVYNKYLLRIVKLQIDTTKLYSALIIESKVHISDRLKLISESFNDNDKLTPARRLSEIMKVQKIEEFLIKPSIKDIVITWGTLAGVILPLVISVLQLLFHVKQ
jgi:hypothetical protein